MYHFLDSFQYKPVRSFLLNLDNNVCSIHVSHIVPCRIKAMEYYNPVAIINERNMESKNDNYGANIRATLNILPIKGLKWENFVSYDYILRHPDRCRQKQALLDYG